MKKLTKLLSPNDVGETASHQAGMLVPKYGGFLSFFPKLDHSRPNPDMLIWFTDNSGRRWEFRFIYYNNARFGGTRDEYRLTRMTRFMRAFDATSADGIVLTLDSNNTYHAEIVKNPLGPGGARREPRGDLPGEIEYERSYDLVFDGHWNLSEMEDAQC